MFENVGEMAGRIWTALNEKPQQGVKDLKKVTKAKTEKEVLVALGWLLREDKLAVSGTEKEPVFSLK